MGLYVCVSICIHLSKQLNVCLAFVHSRCRYVLSLFLVFLHTQHPSGYEASLDPWLQQLWKVLRTHNPLPTGVEEVGGWLRGWVGGWVSVSVLRLCAPTAICPADAKCVLLSPLRSLRREPLLHPLTLPPPSHTFSLFLHLLLNRPSVKPHACSQCWTPPHCCS